MGSLPDRQVEAHFSCEHPERLERLAAKLG
jgi:hypothetical protein